MIHTGNLLNAKIGGAQNWAPPFMDLLISATAAATAAVIIAATATAGEQEDEDYNPSTISA